MDRHLQAARNRRLFANLTENWPRPIFRPEASPDALCAPGEASFLTGSCRDFAETGTPNCSALFGQHPLPCLGFDGNRLRQAEAP